jgi:hypothetical protein
VNGVVDLVPTAEKDVSVVETENEQIISPGDISVKTEQLQAENEPESTDSNVIDSSDPFLVELESNLLENLANCKHNEQILQSIKRSTVDMKEKESTAIKQAQNIKNMMDERRNDAVNQQPPQLGNNSGMRVYSS